MYRRAILFKQDQARPLIWVECETMYESGIGPWEYARVDSLLGDDNPYIDQRYIQENTRRDKNLSHTIEVIFRDTFLLDGYKPNRSIGIAVGASGSLTHNWRGPGLVMHNET
jgi:hypothetical protein